MLHGGDCDSTGVIAGALFGAIYGFEGVYPINFKCLEKLGEAQELAGLLFLMGVFYNKLFDEFQNINSHYWIEKNE